MFQFNIVFGIVIAFASNAALSGIGENAWRWMLGVAALPSIIYTLMCLGLPESPRWLLTRKGDRAEGLRVLGLIEPDSSLAEREAEADEIITATEQQRTHEGFWSWKLRVPILLAFLVAFFNQLSGINAILYFAPRIFELTGLGAKAALLQSVGIGVTNLDLHLRRPLAHRSPRPAHAADHRILSATSLRSGFAHGPFSRGTSRSCPRASLPSSPHTRLARAR
jgi:hypothetical protein